MKRKNPSANDRKTRTEKPSRRDNKLPFFARFLETQDLSRVAGGANETHKHPSDTDEGN